PRSKGLPYVAVPSMATLIKKAPTPKDEPIPVTDRPAPAYRHRALIEDRGNMTDMVDKVLRAPITLTSEEVLSALPEIRETLKKIISKRRMAMEPKKTLMSEETEPDPQEEEEDIIYEMIEEHDNYVDMDDLPRASFSVIMEDDPVSQLKKGSIIVGDPVMQYLNTAKEEGYELRKVLVSRESQSLKALHPVINGMGREEALLDGGSQIVSMASVVANWLNIAYDPTVIIHMQSANKQVEPTLGLAKNIPFSFDEITLYLQVHIINDPAYKVLLGRPFDALATTKVKNSLDGGQSITITDPNSGKRITMPTYLRGNPPAILKLSPEPGFQ
ncbi:hypothetical protein M413DRAFT_45927, partial [Hebeloma cylindrosporum]